MICPCCGKPKKPRIPEGLGTALKPAAEFAAVLRKPLSESTVAANVLRWSTGALNIDACRVANDGENARPAKGGYLGYRGGDRPNLPYEGRGRWPANVAHDGSPEVLAAFAKFGEHASTIRPPTGRDDRGIPGFVMRREDTVERGHADTGTAARFFYTAKASADDRCDSSHPTVKPAALMEWLVTLVTPPGGRVLDCFAGTGSTLVACDRLGFDAVGIEQDAQTVADAHEKIRRFRARRAIGDVAERPAVLPGQGELAL